MGVRRAVALVLLDTEVEVAPGFRTPARAALAVAGLATAGVCRLLQPPAQRARPAAPVSSLSTCAPSIFGRLPGGAKFGASRVSRR